jgi:hypothetical protein
VDSDGKIFDMVLEIFEANPNTYKTLRRMSIDLIQLILVDPIISIQADPWQRYVYRIAMTHQGMIEQMNFVRISHINCIKFSR